MDYASQCVQGQVPLLSIEALHQLHMFVFVLAVVHVIFCVSTMVLGGAKVSLISTTCIMSALRCFRNSFLTSQPSLLALCRYVGGKIGRSHFGQTLPRKEKVLYSRICNYIPYECLCDHKPTASQPGMDG